MGAPGRRAGIGDFPYLDSNNSGTRRTRPRGVPCHGRAGWPDEPTRHRATATDAAPDHAPAGPAHRSPSAGRSPSRPTATSGSTTGTGCGTRTTPRSSPTSRPRTPTPRRPWPAPAGLQEALFAEMVARIEETDLSVPVRKGPWRYYSRTVEGSSYGIHCRRPVDGPRRTPSRSSSTRTCWPRATTTSPSATSRSAPTTAGWSTPPTPPAASGTPCGSATSTTGAESDESIEDTSYGVAWANDNATVFYVRVDEAMRPFQLWRHRVGHRPGRRRAGHRGARRPLLPRRGPDQGRPVRPVRPRLQGHLRGPRARRRRPDGRLPVVEPRRQGIEYRVDHDRGDPASGRPGALPRRHQRRRRGLPAHGGTRRRPGPGPLDRGHPGPARRAPRRRRPLRPPPGRLRARGRRDPDPGRRRTPPAPRPRWTSPSRPRPCGARRTPSTTRPSCATATRRWPPPGRSTTSTSTDGGAHPPQAPAGARATSTPPGTGPTRLWADGRPTGPGSRSRWCTAPTWWRTRRRLRRRRALPPLRLRLLRGSMDPTFSSLRLSLLDRGFVFAIAHVRGGGELGRHWYEEGKLAAKPQHLHRLRGLRPPPGRRRLDLARPAGGPGRQCRRPADGGGGQPGSRPVPGHRRRGALRRLPHHHPRRDACPSPSSSGRSGATRSRTPRSTRS